MNPTAAVSITARDKTGAGIKAAEKSLSGLSRKTQGLGKGSGLAEIGNQLEKLTSIRGLGQGFDDTARGMSLLGATSQRVAAGMAAASGEAKGLAIASASAFEVLAGTAVGMTAIAAGLTTIGLAGGMAAWSASKKYAGLGAEIGRTAASIGVTTDELQASRDVAERFGLTADQATSAMDGLASSIYGAKTGANNFAAGVLTQLGIKLKQTKDGAVDVHQAMLDVADAIARQKDPMKQRAIAGALGVTSMLPVLREGSGAIRAEEGEIAKAKLSLTPAEIERRKSLLRRQVIVEQHLSARVGRPAANAMMNGVDNVIGEDPGGKIDHAMFGISEAANDLADAGKKAARAIADSVRAAVSGPSTFDSFENFARRIEQQESGGKQFNPRGQPLTSSAGAVGVMQMLPSTAERTAQQHGIPWNPEALRHNEAYNRNLGRLHVQDRLEARGGNQVLAAADYNAGPAATNRWIKRFGDPRKGEITDAEFARLIPFEETKNYVANTARMVSAPAPAQTPPIVVAQKFPAPAQPQGRADGAATAHYAPPTPQGRSAMARPEISPPQGRSALAQQEPTAPQGRPSSARVDIHLHNAPKGTVAHVSGAPGVTPTLRVMRALED